MVSSLEKSVSIERTVFHPLEQKVLRVLTELMSEKDFTVSKQLREQGIGPHLGLTNKCVREASRKIHSTIAPLTQGDLWVYYAGLTDLGVSMSMVHAEETDPAAVILRPVIDRLKGKILQLRGFNNSAVDQLLNAS